MQTLIFDFDDTLFNTQKFKNDFLRTLAHTSGIPLEKVQSSFSTFAKTHPNYTLDTYSVFLKKKYPTATVSKNIIHTISFQKYFKKSDVAYLKKLKEQYTLILLTKGNRAFQNFKIKSSIGIDLFSKIYITPEEKEMFLEKHPALHSALFINDKEKENRILAKAFPSLSIYHFTGYVDAPCPPRCVEIKSLRQIKKRKQ